MIRTSAQRKKALLARRRRVNASLKPATPAPVADEQRDGSPDPEPAARAGHSAGS
jgi:hypothetical protein